MKELDPKNQDSNWETPVVRNSAQKAIGASFFLTSEDLQELGIDTESIDHVQYRITGQGRIKIMSASGKE